MGAWRIFLKEHRWLALWLIAAALAVKALVPAGYMLADTGKTLTVAICDGTGPAMMTIDIPVDPGHAKAPDGSKQDGGCAFSALGHAAMNGGADPVLLIAAIAFLLALGFAPASMPVLRRRSFAQPPLRGPPATA